MSATSKLHIETARLVITRLTLDMAEAVVRQSQDADTRRFLPDEVFDTLEEAKNAIRELIAAYQQPNGPYVYAIIQKCGALVGYVQLCRMADGWEIGYHIAAEHTRHGYATEAVRAFLPAIMECLGLARIWGIVDDRNAASCRVLEKCGFTLVEHQEGLYHGDVRMIRRYQFGGQ